MAAQTQNIDLSADALVASLLKLSETETVCLLDSCGVGHLASHLLIVGIDPVDMVEMRGSVADTLAAMDRNATDELACVFTLSYGFGNKLLNIAPEIGEEPDLFLARLDVLIIHDYASGNTRLVGNSDRFDAVTAKIKAASSNQAETSSASSSVSSNFTKQKYLNAIEEIKERIRCGDTYQTNLTHQLTAELPRDLSPQQIFANLRRDHPAPFAAFITRKDSTVISASPERFFKIENGRITTSPIKGTRPRGKNSTEDAALRNELLRSSKDRAENTMIVDLLRNDLGRVCDYGSVRVEKLCDLEEHPTFFHLVSTISGELREDTKFSEILTALFPCGSITGAPKISTMKIINEIEKTPRGLSMGAIGYHIPDSWGAEGSTFDLSVAIRTMGVRERTATFNVGGGIVIDSDPEMEWEETLVKAKALLSAINGLEQQASLLV